MTKRDGNKLRYYLRNIILNSKIIRKTVKKINKPIDLEDEYINNRVKYYIKSSDKFNLEKKFVSSNELTDTIKNIIHKRNKRNDKYSVYTLDFINVAKYFDNNNIVSVHFGDVRAISSQPTFTKSRSLQGNNSNNILLKLNKVRHYNFIKNDIKFSEKKNMLVYRGGENKICLSRNFFKNNFSSNNLIDMDNKFMTVRDQCNYKFILSLEGNDVATNLSWIMSSNSVCFMLKPTCETWFMQGKLIANYHYVLIKDDFCDLEEKILFYLKNEDKCLQIINNANKWVDQFRNEKIEKKIEQKVFQIYLQNCINNE